MEVKTIKSKFRIIEDYPIPPPERQFTLLENEQTSANQGEFTEVEEVDEDVDDSTESETESD